MSATLLISPHEIIHLSGISWNTYENLLAELSDRRLRLTYNRSNLEMINIPIPEIAGFLQKAETMDYLELVKVFCAWVRNQMGK